MSNRQVENYHVNPSLIIRDTELFSRENGLGFHSNGILQKHPGAIVEYTEPRQVWLERETEEVGAIVKSGKSVLVEGDLGSGKSAIIYGLRALYRDSGLPYSYFDGHYVTTRPEKIAAALRWSEKNSAVCFFDSLDYLVGSSRRVRKMSKKKHGERSRAVIDVLINHVSKGGVLVGTTHTESWLNAYADEQLLDGKWTELVTKMNRHVVRGVFDTPEQHLIFLRNAGFSLEEAHYFANLPTNPLLRRIVDAESGLFDQSKLVDSLRGYKISKLIALDPRERPSQMRVSLRRLVQGEEDEEQVVRQLVMLVDDFNQETLVRMGSLDLPNKSRSIVE